MAHMDRAQTFSARGLRTGLFATIDALQLPRLFLGKAPRILLYHGVTDKVGEGIFNYRSKFVTTEAFRTHITWLKKNFTILPLTEYIARLNSGTLPPYALSLTFDDGYANNYEEAYPILREAGVPATFFITTDFVEKQIPLPVDIIEYAIGMSDKEAIAFEMNGQPRTYMLGSRRERIRSDLLLRNYMKKLSDDKAASLIDAIVRECGHDLRENLSTTPYRPMTWDQMREMETHGMTFAAHTRTHPILSRLSRERAQQEILGSKETLARELARPLSIFAYPNGGKNDYTEETIGVLQSAGFTASLTTMSGVVEKNVSPFSLPRFTMDGANDIHRARLIVSGLYSRLS